MTDTPRRTVVVGLLPSGGVTFVGEGEVDPVARMIAEAHAKLDHERDAAERQRLAAIADIERARRTRLARAARRFRRALKMFARLK